MKTCSTCGGILPEGRLGGLCPRCLVALGLNAGAEDTLPVSESPLVPGTRVRYFGDYEILEEIGRGGMGVVYKARQVSLGRMVALKMIQSGVLASEIEIKRFLNEAQAAASLNHPSIVAIHEVGEHLGQHYLSMSLIEGRNLAEEMNTRESLNKDSTIPCREAALLLVKVARAVHHAHQRRILHRDLKPSNILLDAQGEPHVADFGLARRVDVPSDATLSGVLLGTPSYMSPEQAQGKTRELTTATDVYGLGTLLYFALTGRPLFRGNTALETLRMVLEQEPVRPSALNPGMDRFLEAICLKCLEKDPERRYPSAEALAEDLGRWLRNEVIVAQPSTRWERAVKWAKRKPAIAGLTTACVLIFLAGFAGVTWKWRAEQQARAASQKAQQAESVARQKTEHVLDQMQIQRAEEMFTSDSPSLALAQLAWVIRRDPSNRVATERLMSALTYPCFSLPGIDPLKHEGQVCAAQFSPDGLRVVTGSGDATARVWDAQTGIPLTKPVLADAVTSAQFSPDGLRVVTGSWGDTARVWDAQTGILLNKPLQHEREVWSAQFSPDGLRVVTASWDKTARVWDVLTGNPLTEPLQHQGMVWAAQFSPDGLRVVTASTSGACVWDAQTGKPLIKPLRHESVSRFAQFSPDGLRVLTGSTSGAWVWDAQTGEPITQPLKHERRVLAAQFSPDGLRVVTASEDKTARVWDAQTGKPLTEPLQHESVVSSAQFSPDGLRVVTASSDKTARVWDAQTGKPLAEPFRHEDVVESAQFSADGFRIVTASLDETAQVWNAQGGEPITQPLKHERRVLAAQFSLDGLRVVTASEDKTARVWDAQTGKPITEPLKHEGIVWAAQFSSNGLRVVTASSDKTARVWDAQSGKSITEPLQHEQAVHSAEFSPNGLRVVTASHDKTARVWDAQTGKPLTEALRHEKVVSSAQFSPDGLRVVTASEDKTARVWDAQSGKPITEPLKHEGIVWAAQFSSNGLRVVTASSDKTARVWDAQTGKPVGEAIRHVKVVRSAHFSLDGLRVVTASEDKTARVWDAQSGKPITEPLKHEGIVWAAQFSPDGLRIVTASGEMRVWDAQTGNPLIEPFHQKGGFQSAQFSPDGLCVVTASADGTARVLEMPFTTLPAPLWLPELAETVAGKRLTKAAVLESVAAGERLKLKEQLSMAPATNYYGRWAKWFCADRSTRTISPLSSITVPKYVQRRIDENTLASLKEAVNLSPTNGLAFARLAKQVLEQSDKDNPRRVGEADFFSRYALKWSPNDAEVARIRTEVEEQIETLKP